MSPPLPATRGFGVVDDERTDGGANGDVAVAGPGAPAAENLGDGLEKSSGSPLGNGDRQGSSLDGDGSGVAALAESAPASASALAASLSTNKRKLASLTETESLEEGEIREETEAADGGSGSGSGSGGEKWLSPSSLGALSDAEADTAGKWDSPSDDFESDGGGNTSPGGGGRGACSGANSKISAVTLGPRAAAAASPAVGAVERQGRAKRLRKNHREERLQRNSQVTAATEKGVVALAGNPKRSKVLPRCGDN